MKIIKVIFFSLLALILIIGTGIFIFLQIFDTDQYLPKLTQQVSITLGRPVSIGHVGIGFSWDGITLDAGPIIVADDPAFTSQPFISVDRVRVSLDWGSLIVDHKVRAAQIFLLSPQVHFIRSEDGNINARSIGPKSQPVLPGPKGDAMAEGTTNTPHHNRICSVKIQDAAISFIDQSSTMPLDIWLTHINVSLKSFALSDPFQLSFSASPLVLKGISPGEEDSPILKDIDGKLQISLASLKSFSSRDLTANGEINTTGGVIKNFNIFNVILSRTLGAFGELKGPLGVPDTVINKSDVKFSIHDKAVEIDDFLIDTNIFELSAHGSIDQGLNLDMDTTLRLNTDISAALINELGGLKYLCDDSNRITIGAGLKGIIPHLKYKPNKDFRKKSRKALFESGGNFLGALLGGGIK